MAIFRRRKSQDQPSPSVERLVDSLGEWAYDPNFDQPPGTLYWLQAWYGVNCDGEWEHEFGVSIDTLDNPGLSVKIDARKTPLEDRAYEDTHIERGAHDWLTTWVGEGAFQVKCGPLNLGEALNEFRRWAQAPPAVTDRA